jgi:hypothetical protein
MSKETTMLQEAFRISDFCQRYAISRASFYREIAAERLHVIKVGRRTLIARKEAERWFESLCALRAVVAIFSKSHFSKSHF